MAKKGKHKFERDCYNCKYWQNCKEKFKVKGICDKFKFDATSKSV